MLPPEAQALVDGAFAQWCQMGVRWLGARDGVLRENFPASTSPKELDAARARGLTIFHVAEDREQLIGAILDTANYTLQHVMGEMRELGPLFFAPRGQA